MSSSGEYNNQMPSDTMMVEVANGIWFRVYDEFNTHIVDTIIKRAEAFDMEKIIRRYMRDYHVSLDIAEIHHRELKRFLVLSAIFDEEIGMRGAVDNLWHTFLLFTREYLEFCYLIAGTGIIIHHAPNTELAEQNIAHVDTETMPHDYLTFWRAYKYIFGVSPPADAWPQ
ncbi:hypothetical protein [Pseudochrobactrum asaccharolyticum]|uniref:hypothetical protein n=1 Tax=Pseudochrobactrum asaccharolyticum TaxID=354351 RepID=UPI0040434C29